MRASIDGEWVKVSLPTGFRADQDAIVLEPADVRHVLHLNNRERTAWLGQLLARFPSERARAGYLPGAFGPELVGASGFEQSEADELRAALGLLLDAVDYQRGACRLTELIGAVLPQETLSLARDALERTKR